MVTAYFSCELLVRDTKNFKGLVSPRIDAYLRNRYTYDEGGDYGPTMYFFSKRIKNEINSIGHVMIYL